MEEGRARSLQFREDGRGPGKITSVQRRWKRAGQDHFSSVQLLSLVWLFTTPWAEACQASLSIISSLSWLKLMSIESVMLSNHRIVCHPLLLLPSFFPSIRVIGVGDWDVQTAMYKWVVWICSTAQEICPTFYNNYKWSIIFKNSESPCCIPEIDIIL